MIKYETVWFTKKEILGNQYPCAVMADPRSDNLIKDGLIVSVPSISVDKGGTAIPLRIEFSRFPSIPVVPSKKVIESFIMGYWKKEFCFHFFYVCRMPDNIHFGIVAHPKPLRKLTQIEIHEIKKKIVYDFPFPMVINK